MYFSEITYFTLQIIVVDLNKHFIKSMFKMSIFM